MVLAQSNLAKVQTVLARLFTDAPFRDSFFADPAVVEDDSRRMKCGGALAR